MQVFAPSGEWVAYDFEKLTVTNVVSNPTATKTTVAVPADPGRARRARAALISVETNGIRYRFDGGNPSATDGHPAAAGETILIEGIEAVKRLKFIRSGGADATVQITYFRTA